MYLVQYSILFTVGQTLTMRNITVVIREVTEWREVGVKLGIKPYKLEEIRLNRMNDVQHCKVRTYACTLYLSIQYIYVYT